MADKTPMVLDATSASGLGKLQVGDRLSPASIPSFKIENTKYVDDSGDDGTGDGSINRPYKTIAHALTVARPGLDSIVVGNGTYTENLTLVGDVPILADISSIPQQVKIVGSHVLPSSGLVAFSYINFQCTSGYLFTLGGTKSPNVIIESCTMNIQSGASGCFEWITTNVNARVNILNSVINIYGNSGYAINCISSVAGKVNLQYTSVQSLVNPNNVIINLTGSITVTHTFDVIIGQIVVAGSSAYNGTSLTMVTGNTPILTTTSSGISSFGLCSINTTSANVVTGVGGFVYGFIGYTNTGSNLNNTLNGGTGAICGQSAPLRLDNSALPTNLQAGLFNYDGTNFYLDLSTSNRVRIATSDKTTGIIPTAQLPIATSTTMGTNFANQAITQYNTSSTINVSELPSNAIGAFYNASSSPITLTLPSGSSYQFVSTVLGNTATAITLQAGDIFSFIYNGANIFVIGYTATGSNINVLNPTTATTTSLNTALANINNSVAPTNTLYKAIIPVNQIVGSIVSSIVNVPLGGNAMGPIQAGVLSDQGIGSKTGIYAEFFNPTPTSGTGTYEMRLFFSICTPTATTAGTYQVSIGNPSISIPAFQIYLVNPNTGDFTNTNTGSFTYTFPVNNLGITETSVIINPAISIDMSYQSFYVGVQMCGWLLSDYTHAPALIGNVTMVLTKI